MELHEYYVKEILKNAGLPVLKGKVAYTSEEACNIALGIGGNSFWVKPQLITSFQPYKREELTEKYSATSPQETEQKAKQILGSSYYAQHNSVSTTIQRIYVEQALDLPLFCGVCLRVDFEKSGLSLSVKNAQKGILSYFLQDFTFDNEVKKQINQNLNLKNPLLKKNFWNLIVKMYRLFKKYEMMAIELNPIVRQGNNLIIENARLIFDPDALFRFPELIHCREIKLGHEREALAKKNAFRYTKLNGNIACLVNGIGLGAASVDLIQSQGEKVACLLDVGTEPNVKSITTAMRLALAEPNVDAIFVNIFGGTTSCKVIAQGLLDAAVEIPVGVPVIIRLAGLEAEDGKKLLSLSKVPFKIVSQMIKAVGELKQELKEKK